MNEVLVQSVVGPALTLVVLALLRYGYTQIRGAISGMKSEVLAEVNVVKKTVDAVAAKQVVMEEKQQGDRDRIARLEGWRDARIEAAQLANAAIPQHKEDTPT